MSEGMPVAQGDVFVPLAASAPDTVAGGAGNLVGSFESIGRCQPLALRTVAVRPACCMDVGKLDHL